MAEYAYNITRSLRARSTYASIRDAELGDQEGPSSWMQGRRGYPAEEEMHVYRASTELGEDGKSYPDVQTIGLYAAAVLLPLEADMRSTVTGNYGMNAREAQVHVDQFKDAHGVSSAPASNGEFFMKIDVERELAAEAALEERRMQVAMAVHGLDLETADQMAIIDVQDLLPQE